ncbi:MAG TPA: hypothetical protein VFP48_11255 [Steroidobacteraceae bacterium]|nr:hypothetical protein [Steroidobacteraceae bacterium]
MVLMVQAVHQTSPHTIGWISMQPDGAVSVGLADRTFISPRFHARQFVWNAYNRVSLQYLVPHSPEELLAVVNPHLTFHPPIYFHLRANGDQELFAGIAEVEIMLVQDGHVPWVRFTSRPVAEIPVAASPRVPSRTSVLNVPVESADVSVGLAIDFVRPGVDDPAGSVAEQFVECGQSRLHVRCDLLAAQPPTLAWYHQC